MMPFFSVALTSRVNKSMFFRSSVSDRYSAKTITAETKNTSDAFHIFSGLKCDNYAENRTKLVRLGVFLLH